MTSTPATGRDWLSMKPGHFDRSLLPRNHRGPEAKGLFSVADVVPAPGSARPPGAELDGQMDLFGETE